MRSEGDRQRGMGVEDVDEEYNDAVKNNRRLSSSKRSSVVALRVVGEEAPHSLSLSLYTEIYDKEK